MSKKLKQADFGKGSGMAMEKRYNDALNYLYNEMKTGNSIDFDKGANQYRSPSALMVSTQEFIPNDVMDRLKNDERFEKRGSSYFIKDTKKTL